MLWSSLWDQAEPTFLLNLPQREPASSPCGGLPLGAVPQGTTCVSIPVTCPAPREPELKQRPTIMGNCLMLEKWIQSNPVYYNLTRITGVICMECLSPQSSHFEILTPNVTVLGGGATGR